MISQQIFRAISLRRQFLCFPTSVGADNLKPLKRGLTVITALWTLLGLIGTTALTAVIGKFVTILFERKADLIVAVSISPSFPSPLLAEEVRGWRKTAMGNDWFKEGSGPFEKYGTYFSSTVYVRIHVKNNSRKKLSALHFSSDLTWNGVFQVGEGELAEYKPDTPVLIGDLQPNREVVVNLLCRSLFSTDATNLRKSLQFSADELGDVRISFPLPPHLKRQYKKWMSWAVAGLSVVVSVMAVMAVLYRL